MEARCLSPEAREVLRSHVLEALRGGRKPAVAARTFGVSRSSVWNWRRRVALGHITSLGSKQRGRPKGRPRAAHPAATTVRRITDRCPDPLKLPFALWTRAAVQHLRAQRFGVQVSVRTVGRYLAGSLAERYYTWDAENRLLTGGPGGTPPKPLRRAYERDPVAVPRWLDAEYPAIEPQARAENAEIHWGDPRGRRADHQTGTSSGHRGQTPVIPGTGQRFRCNRRSTITNRGHLAFLVFQERFTAGVFLRFVRRLLRPTGRKVLRIVDRHPVHGAGGVQHWRAANTQRLALFFRPGYSPELNPDEHRNHDGKRNPLGRQRPATPTELIAGVRSYRRSTQRQPEIVKGYFREEQVRYAAG